MSRLNVIFSKFDEVQRSGNMVPSPVSGRIHFPVAPARSVPFRSFSFRLGRGCRGNVALIWRGLQTSTCDTESCADFFFSTFTSKCLALHMYPVSPITSCPFSNLQLSLQLILFLWLSINAENIPSEVTGENLIYEIEMIRFRRGKKKLFPSLRQRKCTE